MHGVQKHLRRVADVIGNVPAPPPGQQRCVRYRAASREQIYKRMARRQMFHYPLGYFIFAALIGDSVPHTHLKIK